MKIEDVKEIAVLGAGTMGHGIAELAALAGFQTRLTDVSAEQLKKGQEAILWSLNKLAEKGRISSDQQEASARRLSMVESLESAVSSAQVVIEAIPERMDLKRSIFGKLDRFAPADTILATNTSSLSVTEISGATARPAQVLGLHFFNPPVRMQLVEVIRGKETSDATMQLGVELSKRLGRVPIRVDKDVHGFIVNRVASTYSLECLWMVSRGEARIQEIDSRMRHFEGMPMGPFELMDFGGLDVVYDYCQEAEWPIPPLLVKKIEAGELGRKSNRGFYDYGNGGVDYQREDGEQFDATPFHALMTNEAAWLIENGVCSAEDIDQAVQLGLGFTRPVLRHADEIGLDRVLACLQALYERHREERYRPVSMLKRMVKDGQTGRSAGRGFYSY